MSTESTDGAALADEVSDRRSGSRWLAIVRPEEWGLLAILLFCIVLCVSMGRGFSGGRVFSQYFAFFADKVLIVFAATRILFGIAARWEPASGSRAERVKRFVFGRERSLGELLKTDLEVCRADLERTRAYVADLGARNLERRKIFWRGERIEWLLARGYHEWFMTEIAAGRVTWPGLGVPGPGRTR